MLSSQRAGLPPKVAKSGRLRSFVVSYGYAAIYCADNSPIKFRLTGVSFWGLLWEPHFLFLWIQTNLRGQKLLPEGPLRRSSDTCHASLSLSSLLFSALEKVSESNMAGLLKPLQSFILIFLPMAWPLL